MSWVAVGVAGASLLSGVLGSNASEKAAQEQAAAAARAQQISLGEFNTITQQESPFLGAGYGALSQENYLLGIGTPGTATNSMAGTPGTAASSTAGGYGSLLQPFNLSDWQQLSPAYNFQKQQGQQSVLNGAAAGQGAMSGAALKDLTDYNQAEASTSFNNAFNQYQTQQGNIFSRLSGIAGLGQAAASNTAKSGVALAGDAAQSATNIGTAQAAGTIGSASAISGGINSAAPWLTYGGGHPGSAGSAGTNYGDMATAGGYDYIDQGDY